MAEADWLAVSASHVTYTSVGVMRMDGGRELKVEQIKATVDANGYILSGTRTDIDVTRGFTFAIDTKGFTGASVSGVGLPATTCAIDANADPIEPCTTRHVTVKTTWTGQGDINHTLITERHWVAGGPVTIIRTSVTDRDATALGAVAGLRLRTGDLQAAHLGKTVITKTVKG